MSAEPVPYAARIGPEPQPLPLAPLAEGQRIVSLDVLRGVAVLGILLVNIQYFAFPLNEADQWRWQDLSTADVAVRHGVEFFATFKFITIFSLLFGIGLAIQSDRATARGKPFAGTCARRLLVLMAFGLAHGLLLWYGDILLAYAVLGLPAMLLRNIRPRVLLIIAVVLLLIPMCILGGCAAIFPEEVMEGPLDWQSIADDVRADTPGNPSIELFEFMADEEGVYRSGSWGEMVLHRSMTYLVMWLAILMIFSWRCLALFLLGIYFVRRRLHLPSDPRRGAYRRMVLIGLAVGIPLQLVTVWAHAQEVESAWLVMVYFSGLYLGSLGMSLAYVGLIWLVCSSSSRLARLAPLAAVGRMALTNYLSHSIICGFIFYGYGLGLIGSMGYPSTILLVLAIFALQLVLSPIWLRHFQFGPFEWLWRTLTYWRLQPMRRRPPPLALVVETARISTD